jgi:hypothetical protein
MSAVGPDGRRNTALRNPEQDTGSTYRGDSAHFNSLGLDIHAGLWVSLSRSAARL